MTKTATLAMLSSKSRNGESAMVTSENELPGYPLVEATLNAIADWVTNYRNAIGFKNEFGMCGPDEVERMAKDIGVTPSQLQELVRKGPDGAKPIEGHVGRIACRSKNHRGDRPAGHARDEMAVHHLQQQEAM
jgi:hypothetical protein